MAPKRWVCIAEKIELMTEKELFTLVDTLFQKNPAVLIQLSAFLKESEGHAEIIPKSTLRSSENRNITLNEIITEMTLCIHHNVIGFVFGKCSQNTLEQIRRYMPPNLSIQERLTTPTNQHSATGTHSFFIFPPTEQLTTTPPQAQNGVS
ncbi:MAG: hypothetical protein COY58_03490 [Gammaproteobacteria bacterium CG_4_10_14_0_8_um_filter_38_16]|nr:MAG: hypothetical protein COY58_03490 [Gammaproteobacteria bacterium CG_4_10_14_0_8_um_filter_38_16]PJA03646.1 MAG: hypothetical protein COX72_03875 [Gammaproteobacteria bacterium CG_4_10_14_0_2_um_filter_38_22]PJB11312.1 MAG: hypothetical protein CO120_00680 [Gammaproteobacteria bacterium CG_4_9_14_3_um_filter_38_9]